VYKKCFLLGKHKHKGRSHDTPKRYYLPLTNFGHVHLPREKFGH
jgi:hypothetical protein